MTYDTVPFKYFFAPICTVQLLWSQEVRARICKSLRSPGIDSKVSIPPAYVALRAGMIILFALLAARLHRQAESIPCLLKGLQIRALVRVALFNIQYLSHVIEKIVYISRKLANDTFRHCVSVCFYWCSMDDLLCSILWCIDNGTYYCFYNMMFLNIF